MRISDWSSDVCSSDLPLGGTTNFSYGSWLVPELDPAVIRQVEVLRGPQGTLYGASSLGGLMRYVTASPRFDRISGSVSVVARSVSHGEAGFGGAGGPVGRAAGWEGWVGPCGPWGAPSQ